MTGKWFCRWHTFLDWFYRLRWTVYDCLFRVTDAQRAYLIVMYVLLVIMAAQVAFFYWWVMWR